MAVADSFAAPCCSHCAAGNRGGLAEVESGDSPGKEAALGKALGEAALGEEAVLDLPPGFYFAPPGFYFAPSFCATQSSESSMPPPGDVQLAMASPKSLEAMKIRVMALAISRGILRRLQHPRSQYNFLLVRPTKSPRHHDRRRSSE